MVDSSSNTQANLGATFGLVGLGLSLFGSHEQSEAEKQVTQSNINIAQIQQQENSQRQLAMQINARRQQTEAIRQSQIKSSMALAAGTNQGAQFGSGVAGGQAQATGEGAYNLLGINQNLQVGNTLFDLSNKQSQQEIAKFQAQSQAATASGLSSLGADISKAAPLIAQFGMFALGV